MPEDGSNHIIEMVLVRNVVTSESYLLLVRTQIESERVERTKDNDICQLIVQTTEIALDWVCREFPLRFWDKLRVVGYMLESK